MRKLANLDRTIVVHRALMTGLALGALVVPTQARNGAWSGPLARVAVSIPQAVETAGIVMLEITVARTRTPMRRNAGVVVWLAGMEVGRFSIMSADREQRYQFNVGSMVHRSSLAGRIAPVDVAIINRDGEGVPAGSAFS